MKNEKNTPAFVTIKPTVLYFGTPVALITSVDKVGNSNIGPISSVWALGYNLIIGLGCDGKTYQNLTETKECVVNLPSADLHGHIENIASLTGLNPVPEHKREKYRYENDKFSAGGFEPMPAETIAVPGIADCPVQLECRVQDQQVIEYTADLKPLIVSIHLRVINVRVHENLVINGQHIDPSVWSPLIYNFRHYYALGEQMGKNFRAEV